jgi:hypothetical protein
MVALVSRRWKGYDIDCEDSGVGRVALSETGETGRTGMDCPLAAAMSANKRRVDASKSGSWCSIIQLEYVD